MIKIPDSKRVVITGLGVISSIGIGWQEFWKNLLAGKSGISKIESFDTSQYDRHYGGEVKNFDPYQFIDKRKVKRMGRASQMAIAAAKLALKDAGFTAKFLPREKTGVCIGTTMGESQILEILNKAYLLNRVKEVRKDFVSIYPVNAISSHISKELNFEADNIVFSTACASGNYSIGYAFDLIKKGEADLMFAGGVDAFSMIAFTGFHRLLAMAPKMCQPFDKNRKGMMLGGGAGILILESLESAKQRKASIYAEILGYGLSCDANSMTASAPRQIEKATIKALKNANLRPDDIDYISAHGTGTKENDRAECKAIFDVFGQRSKKIPVSSIKSMLGHTMGAAAAIEAAVCCLVIKKGKIPPTTNFRTKDEKCDIDCVANRSRNFKVKTIANNSQAFGGNNACLIPGSLKRSNCK